MNTQPTQTDDILARAANTGMAPQTPTEALDALQHTIEDDPDQLATLALINAHIDRRSRVLEDIGRLMFSLAANPKTDVDQKQCQRLALRAARALCDNWQNGAVPR